ncbi:hypothetical protein D3C75_952470 [compost metagenome]
MFKVWCRKHIANGLDASGNRGFVVSAQQAGAIGGDDILADVVQQLREYLDSNHFTRGRQHNICTRVVFDTNSMSVIHVIWRGVEVRKKHNRGHVRAVRGQAQNGNRILIHRGLNIANISKFTGDKLR